MTSASGFSYNLSHQGGPCGPDIVVYMGRTSGK